MIPTKKQIAALHVSDARKKALAERGGFRKIEDWGGAHRKGCRDPSHSPPGMIVLEPGHYEYTCPGCGHVTPVTVPPKPTLSAKQALETLNSAAGDGAVRDPLYDEAYRVLLKVIEREREREDDRFYPDRPFR